MNVLRMSTLRCRSVFTAKSLLNSSNNKYQSLSFSSSNHQHQVKTSVNENAQQDDLRRTTSKSPSGVNKDAFNNCNLMDSKIIQAAFDASQKEIKSSLVYEGPETMIKMIKMIKTFSISTTLIALGVQPFIINHLLQSSTSSFAMGFAILTSSGMVLSPLILNLITRRYVTQLDYDQLSQVFSATTLNLINRPSVVKYKSSDVSVPEALGIFTTFFVSVGEKKKKRPLFVDPEFVVNFDAYKRMLGYDRPIDIKINGQMEFESRSVSQQERKRKES